MKKVLVTLMALASLTALAAKYRNGVYRGVFVSGQETQVEVQFTLTGDKVEKASYRTLAYKGENYLKNEKLTDQKAKYQAALEATVGKPVDEALEMLYKPADIEKAGASVRGTKIRAAMQNALIHGVYTPAK